MNLHIASKIHDYDVLFEDSFDFIATFYTIPNTVFIIDQNVHKLYSHLFKELPPENLFLLEAIESNKTLVYTQKIYDFLLDRAVKRNLTIISIGGGITQDITGFVASTLYRGIKWIFVPTTFLSITDSCIGSKTSINYGSFKNLIGTFYPPHKIYINPDFLNTLSTLDFYNGIGETIKFQLMKEGTSQKLDQTKKVIETLKTNPRSRLSTIHDNLQIKLSYMLEDEFDLGKRNLLNYGHCFGHALETASAYYVPHGIAVAIGILFANILSFSRNLIDQETLFKVNSEIVLPNIPLALREKDFETSKLLSAMKNDKKRIGRYLSVIVPNKTFSMIKIDNVTDDEFHQTLSQLILLLFHNKGVTK